MTPLEVVKMYNEECWHSRKIDLVGDIIADNVVRHYPGKNVTLTREESIARIEDGWKQLPTLAFRFHRFLVDDNMITMIWDATSKDAEGKDMEMAGIEVFRVEDGKICEVWNPEYAFECWKFD